MATPTEFGEINQVTVYGDRVGAGPNGPPNAGGVADAWNPGGGAANIFSGLVISGSHNQDQGPVGSSRTTTPDRAQYYSGYWAGVQGALYGFGPPAAPPIHAFGFEMADVLGLNRPGIPSGSAQDITRALGSSNVTHPMELRLTPEGGSWSFGNGADDWPVDLPDWGGSPSGPPTPGFSPIKGKIRDTGYHSSELKKLGVFFTGPNPLPTEQEIQDAGNPALWLSPDEVGPMNRFFSSPGGSLDPFVGDTLGNATSGTASAPPSPLFPSDINSMGGLGFDFGGPRSFFDPQYSGP